MPSSDQLHNTVCYQYLQALKLDDKSVNCLFPQALRSQFQSIYELVLNLPKHKSYQENFAYGDLYKAFLTYLEENIDTIYREVSEGDRTLLDQFVISIYQNESSILETIYEEVGEHAQQHSIVDSKSIEKKITSALSDKSVKRLNTETQLPVEVGGGTARLASNVAPTFRPQLETSLPVVRQFEYLKSRHGLPRELRMGTQAKREKGKVANNALFKKYLEAQSRRYPEKKVTHVYFNNLGQDRKFTKDFLNTGEKNLTEGLHELEKDHGNVAVITLPADKGLLSKKLIVNNEPTIARKDAMTQFEKVIKGTSELSIKDFRLDPSLLQTIEAMMPEGENHETKVAELLNNSFRAMGIGDDENTMISESQQQAVWFHFLKFEYPNFILKTLNPDTFNFTCKDGIDRGGVSSAYFNLLNSFKTDSPMTRDELEKALHAPPTLVKGRGINSNIKLFWNSARMYVANNYQTIANEATQSWIIDWLDTNCPKEMIGQHISNRINQLRVTILSRAPRSEQDNQALEFITEIESLFAKATPKDNIVLLDLIRTIDNIVRKEVIDEDKIHKLESACFENMNAKQSSFSKRTSSAMEVYSLVSRTLNKLHPNQDRTIMLEVDEAKEKSGLPSRQSLPRRDSRGAVETPKQHAYTVTFTSTDEDSVPSEVKTLIEEMLKHEASNFDELRDDKSKPPINSKGKPLNVHVVANNNETKQQLKKILQYAKETYNLDIKPSKTAQFKQDLKNLFKSITGKKQACVESTDDHAHSVTFKPKR